MRTSLPLRKKLFPILLLFTALAKSPLSAFAMGGGVSPKGPVAPMKREEIITSVSLFLFLFTVLALLHAAEIAITTLYPWKVREFAEEEQKQGKERGVFKILNEDITRVLTAILVTSTTFSIYGESDLYSHVRRMFITIFRVFLLEGIDVTLSCVSMDFMIQYTLLTAL
jgi:CBS domain containing-hemolysin-like protein